jgi:hypothetical protein
MIVRNSELMFPLSTGLAQRSRDVYQSRESHYFA